jgi:hypothetical protein
MQDMRVILNERFFHFLYAYINYLPKLYFECGIPRPQDVSNLRLRYCHFLNPFIISIAVLENVPPDAGLQKRATFSSLNVGLAGTGNRTWATCVASSGTNHPVIHYALDESYTPEFLNRKLTVFQTKPKVYYTTTVAEKVWNAINRINFGIKHRCEKMSLHHTSLVIIGLTHPLEPLEPLSGFRCAPPSRRFLRPSGRR